jgi:hypothetical protein
MHQICSVQCATRTFNTLSFLSAINSARLQLSVIWSGIVGYYSGVLQLFTNQKVGPKFFQLMGFCPASRTDASSSGAPQRRHAPIDRLPVGTGSPLLKHPPSGLPVPRRVLCASGFGARTSTKNDYILQSPSSNSLGSFPTSPVAAIVISQYLRTVCWV